MDAFINGTYAGLENRVRVYKERGEGDFESIMRDIRKAALYGDIESYEQIRLEDLMGLDTADDIDDGYIEKHDHTTGGIQTSFTDEEKYDMPELDDFEEEGNDKEEGFLTLL